MCFDLLTPPVLEFEWFNREQTGNIQEDSRKFRQRIGFIDSKHQIVAPYAHQVLLTLFRSDDLEEFVQLCIVAGLRRPLFVSVDSEARGLYQPKKLYQASKWIKTLDWPIAFQLEAALHNGLLHTEVLINTLRKPISDLAAKDSKSAGEILRKFNEALQSISPSESIITCFKRVVNEHHHNVFKTENLQEPSGLFRCYHVTFTPTRMLLEGPYSTQSNRVVRMYRSYQDHFLRVDFRDEDRLQYRWDREVDGTTFLEERVGGILRTGFELAGRPFQFLAYSSSALRNHSVWFVNPFYDDKGVYIDAKHIRKELGDFSGNANCPSKYAARLAQAFTATDPSVTIFRHQWKEIPDVGKKPYEHTDGAHCSRQLLRRET